MVSKVGERERETGLVVVAAVEEKEEEVGDAPKFNDVLAWLLGMCLRRPHGSTTIIFAVHFSLGCLLYSHGTNTNLDRGGQVLDGGIFGHHLFFEISDAFKRFIFVGCQLFSSLVLQCILRLAKTQVTRTADGFIHFSTTNQFLLRCVGGTQRKGSIRGASIADRG